MSFACQILALQPNGRYAGIDCNGNNGSGEEYLALQNAMYKDWHNGDCGGGSDTLWSVATTPPGQGGGSGPGGPQPQWTTVVGAKCKASGSSVTNYAISVTSANPSSGLSASVSLSFECVCRG